MRLAAVVLLVPISALAQSSSANSGFGRTVFPGGSGPGSVSNTGFGRIVFPGTGAPAVIRPGVNPGPVFPILTGPQVQHQQHSNRNIVPIPVFYGGGYYNYDPPPAQMVVVANQPAPYIGPQPYYPPYPAEPPSRDEQPPVVVINQYFRSEGPSGAEPAQTQVVPQVQAPAPTAAAAPPQDDMRNVFLIAMKDHTVYAASAYWVENNTLNYITIQGDQNSASLDAVDRELSTRLNRDRRVAFGLPQ